MFMTKFIKSRTLNYLKQFFAPNQNICLRANFSFVDPIVLKLIIKRQVLFAENLIKFKHFYYLETL